MGPRASAAPAGGRCQTRPCATYPAAPFTVESTWRDGHPQAEAVLSQAYRCQAPVTGRGLHDIVAERIQRICRILLEGCPGVWNNQNLKSRLKQVMLCLGALRVPPSWPKNFKIFSTLPHFWLKSHTFPPLDLPLGLFLTSRF